MDPPQTQLSRCREGSQKVHFVSSKVQGSIALRAFKVGWRVRCACSKFKVQSSIALSRVQGSLSRSRHFERSTAESKNLRLFFRI